ncbi:MAG: DUF5009 domain-containing protein [Planctomycetes bacterium]|nr:DUF5009 domain-containing protein [Planctomycetota bacterium]MCB9868247.1 DUF5009 domain-containing protein [Planctomycetota bacterium]MCB9888777.1 DUF5009 domain-containing protein [Planctomycetota bacterium]
MRNPTASHRRLALDAFRGLTIAGMILVNNPGDWGAVFGPLRHAAWHGCTLADLVFPSFLFVVGVSISVALRRRVERRDPWGALTWRILRRGVLLFALGLWLAVFPGVEDFADWKWKDFGRLRIPGVLQRIALCYSVAAPLYLGLSGRLRLVLAVALLLGYQALLGWYPLAGGGVSDLSDPQRNLVAVVDRAVFGVRLWRGTWDPEGLLSTVPALGTTLLGTWVGDLWLRDARPEAVARRMFGWGIVWALGGYVWSVWMPFNKPLWTGSYALWTAGLSASGLAACIWCEQRRGAAVLRPFAVYGQNALLVFVLSGMLGRLLTAVRWRDGGQVTTLKSAVFRNTFGWIQPPELASLAFAAAFVVGFFALLLPLYRRGWRWRV